MNLEENKYLIAGIKTTIYSRKEGRTAIQAKDYLCDFEGEPEIITGVTDEFIEEKLKDYPQLTKLECEYVWTGAIFCDRLWMFDALMLHSSAVVYQDKAYLFSAPSGTGKSTHTALWCELFGEGAYILNDDKPVIRIVDGEVMVYGTPWSGKTNQNKNVGVPLQGICFIERAKENKIRQVNVAEAVQGMLSQTVRRYNVEEVDKLIAVIDKILSKIKVYKMGCNISTDAAKVAYEGMSGSAMEEHHEN